MSDVTFGYADRNKAIVVDEHSYRLVAVVGVQPGRAKTLLGDVDAGTPQRYLWLPSLAPGTPEADVAAPEPINLGEITRGGQHHRRTSPSGCWLPRRVGSVCGCSTCRRRRGN